MIDKYHVYANRMQAKKIITILKFTQFSGIKVVTRSIKIHYEKF